MEISGSALCILAILTSSLVPRGSNTRSPVGKAYLVTHMANLHRRAGLRIFLPPELGLVLFLNGSNCHPKGRSLVPFEHLSVKDQRMLDFGNVIEIET
jgi:hypothetical protein